MVTRLYIARHGQSKWNLENRMQGMKDIELSELGIKQADLLAKRLEEENIEIIYSSDLKRAYMTAEIIAERIKIPFYKEKEFREMSFGVWEGLTAEEIEKNYTGLYSLWKKDPVQVFIEKGETLKQVQSRMLKKTWEIVEKNRGKNILIVSHGTSIKALILGLLDIDLSFYPSFRMDNASLNIVDIKENKKAVLVLYNDTCHLRERK
ncbi:MAG: histidine phosphatase family protein [Caldanaerobacter sp.]|uniref:histidine phosphatase family protein n=1 Tax=Caldanaerobacter sp. TaxID=2930036 RepID=UPI003C762312